MFLIKDHVHAHAFLLLSPACRQRRLGHAAALSLIAQLQDDRIILGHWPNRESGIHPDHRQERVQSIEGDIRSNYIERVVQLSLFFFELAEEDTNGHSRLIKEQLPACRRDWRTIQKMFRTQWYGTELLSLTDAALAFHRWLDQQVVLPDQLGVEAAIRAGCLPYERTFERIEDPQVRLDRSYVRLARFYRRMLREDITRHTRTTEWFVSSPLSPQNTGQPDQHPEHVVPCAVLRDTAIRCFATGWSVHQVAHMLRRRLVVIWIGQAERKLLDHGPDNLKDCMPTGWSELDGCLYARLHHKKVIFNSAPGYPCLCATQVGQNVESAADRSGNGSA